jgi:hypothetical protein
MCGAELLIGGMRIAADCLLWPHRKCKANARGRPSLVFRLTVTLVGSFSQDEAAHAPLFASSGHPGVYEDSLGLTACSSFINKVP